MRRVLAAALGLGLAAILAQSALAEQSPVPSCSSPTTALPVCYQLASGPLMIWTTGDQTEKSIGTESKVCFRIPEAGRVSLTEIGSSGKVITLIEGEDMAAGEYCSPPFTVGPPLGNEAYTVGLVTRGAVEAARRASLSTGVSQAPAVAYARTTFKVTG